VLPNWLPFSRLGLMDRVSSPTKGMWDIKVAQRRCSCFKSHGMLNCVDLKVLPTFGRHLLNACNYQSKKAQITRKLESLTKIRLKIRSVRNYHHWNYWSNLKYQYSRLN
jgi:hypothetical protein